MFEQVNKKLKRRLSKAVSIVLCAAMLVTALPAELLGGVANVQAAETATAKSSVFKASDYLTLGTGISENFGSDKTIFTMVASSSKTLTTGTSAGDGFTALPAAVKSLIGGYVSTGGKPDTSGRYVLFTPTTDGTFGMYATANNDGDGTITLYQGTNSSGTKLKDFTVHTNKFTGLEFQTYEVTANTTYCLWPGGSVRFYYLEVGDGSGTSDGDDDLVDYTRTYSFLDGSIVPTDTTNGSSPMSSEDGKLTVAPSASSGFKYNSNQHGVQMADGGTVTITVYGNTTIAVGGCEFSTDGTVKLGNAAAVPLKTTACCNEDGSVIWDESNQIILEYEGTGKQDVVLTFEGTVYCPYIIVSGKEPKPTDVEVEVVIADDSEPLPDGATISLVKSGSTDAIPVANGDKKNLSINATYSAVIKKDGEVVEGLAALFGDTSTVQVAADTKTITITVVSTVLDVTPTITGDELEEGYTLCAVDKNKKVVELTNGTAVTLSKDTEYNVEVKDADGNTLEDWVVYVDNTDSSKFKTGKDKTQNISVKVEHVTEVTVTAKISGKGMLGDNKLYLTAGDESVEVVSEKPMTLKPNTEYTLEIKTEAGAAVTSLEATVNGETKYKTGTKNEEIEISVSVPATKTTAYGKKYTTDTFAKVNGGNVTAVEGEVLPGTNILYKTYVSSGVTYDNQLRFRNGNVLWLPIQDDTTRITYVQASNANQPRYVHIGYKDSGYKVQMLSGEASITIDDITDLIETDDAGKKYLPIVSDNDVKLDGIKWIEYNPVNTVTVTGTIAGIADVDQEINTIRFKNLTNPNADIISADVDADGKYSVELRRVAGETRYAASIPLTEYKIDDTDDKDKFFLLGNEPTAVQDFTVVEVPLAKVTGTITGIRDELREDKGDLGVSLIPENEALDPIPLTLTKTTDGYSFAEVTVERNKSYGVKLTNADDDEVIGKITPDAATYTASIIATPKPTVAVTGNFITSDRKDAEVTKITFTNIETPKYTYTFDVTGTSYTAELRKAEYVTSVECKEGYEAFDKVSVQDVAVTNDVYLQGPVDESPVEYKATIKVGAGEGKDFAKIADAIKYISRMPEDRERVTIVLDEGATYREQLVIDTPNVTIEGNGSTITWYYGVGFSYYSAKFDPVANTAYYDEAYAVDKYTMKAISQNPGHWGATVNLLAGAKGFAAQDLTFENSLNYYVTEEELADGAGENVSSDVATRAEGADVHAKAAKERACVLYIQADDTTYKNCKLLSAQDTLYTGDANENSYFVNCTIEGNTDYICGDGNAVFDKCVLSMYCYSDQQATEGYIVANKAKANHGYLFSECTVVTGTDSANKGTKNNYLARPWDKGTVYFLNTEVETADMIHVAGYKEWNGLAESKYYEYNTHTSEGPVDTSNRETTSGGIMTEEQANAVRITTFFDGWRPLYYEGTVDIDAVTVEVPKPVAGAKVKTEATTATPGVTNLSAITWFEGDATEAYTGERYKAHTAYRAEMTVEAADGFVFASEVTAVVEDAEPVVVVRSEDGKTLTIKASYTTGEEEKLTTTFKLPITNATTSGLKKGRYAGGFTLMDDMGTYGAAGFSNVTGENNHKTGTLIEVSVDSTKAKTVAGEKYDIWIQGLNNPLADDGKTPNGKIPVSGAVLKLDALADGVVTLICNNEDKNISFIDATDPSNVTADATLGLTLLSLWEDQVYTIQVKKGHTYYFYANGSKLVLCGASVVYDGEDVEDNGPVGPGTEDGDDKPGTGDGDDKPGTNDGDDDGTGDGSDSSFDGWDRVARPVINRVEYSSSDGQDKVTVTVTANVGDQGGQKLVVTWKKVGADATQTKTSTTKQKTHKFEFTCEGPGKYEVTATLKRKGLTDKKTTNYVTIKANGKVELTPEREGVHVELLDDGEYTYTGSAIKPAVAVYNGDELLTEGVDYTVKYTNNVKAGNKNDGKKAPTITITGKGRLTGKTTQTFTINKKDLNEDLYDPENGVVIGGMLDGNLVVAENTKISPILVYKGMVLKAGAKKDFELTTGLSKDKAPAAGTAGQTIKIKGVNNYTGELTLTLDVRAKSALQKITAVQLVKGAKYEYNGEKHTAQISAVKAKSATLTNLDYVIVYNGDQTTAGAQKFTVVGLGLYTGSKTTSFKITPRKTTLTHVVDDSLKVGSTVTLSYKSTGVTFNDAITVTDAGLDNAVLVLGKDYKVSYSNNKKAGTGKYSITFLGNYKGSAALKNNTFTITKLNLADLTQTDYPDERYGELYIKSADKAYGKKAAIIKSAPYVLVDGVALKTSDYTVKYYLSNGSEMKGANKVSLNANETATITVEITGKGNCEGTVKTTYDVINAPDRTDISKVKVTPQTTAGKKQGSVPYSGSAVYPDQIVITQGKNTLATLKPDANGDWNTNPDYEVTFVNNIEKGRATIIVTGTGKNVGSKTATYNVASRNLAKDVTSAVFWEDFKDLKDVLFKSAQLFAQ